MCNSPVLINPSHSSNDQSIAPPPPFFSGSLGAVAVLDAVALETEFAELTKLDSLELDTPTFPKRDEELKPLDALELNNELKDELELSDDFTLAFWSQT